MVITSSCWLGLVDRAVGCHPGGPSSIPGARQKDIFASQNSQPIKLQHGTLEAVTYLERFREIKRKIADW